MSSPQHEFPNLSELAGRLGRVEHFRGMQPAEVEAVIRAGQIRRAARGETLFLENEPCAGLYVLLAGQVQVCKLSRDGQIAIIAVFDPVIMFNEVAALDGGHNPATAIALADSLLWRMDADPLEEMILRYPRVGLGLLRVLAGRNRHLVEQFEDLSFRSVLARTAKLLLELSDNGARSIDRRKHPNGQLAARIATGPEAFSRSLKVFKGGGDILATANALRIIRPERLAEVAQVGPAEEAAGR